ncbi:MAG: RsmE family RNA methyltransferase [Bryobacteraceae bacterium]
MARRRFFVPPLRLGETELTGDDAHHLTRVLRVEAGQRYEIVAGGAPYLGEVVEARKNRVVFRAVEPLPLHPLPVAITLYFALIKFDRLEDILEKSTETGVSALVPVIAARSEKGLDRAAAKRRPRWERILLESAQQSRRDAVPTLEDPIPFPAAVGAATGVRFLLDESPAAAPLLTVFPAANPVPGNHPAVSLLTGPEGGWTDQERSLAVASGWTPVSLGPQILRSETAASVSSALVIAACSANAGPASTT